MNFTKSAVLALAALAFSGVGLVQTAAAGPMMMMSSHDKMTMHTCAAMSDQDMMQDHKCAAMMQKTNMSMDDMHTAKACMAMTHDAMMADQNCTTMMKMHGMM